MDKVVRIATLPGLRSQASADLRYWMEKPMAERIAAVEVLRREALATSDSPDVEPRLQRVCRVARRERG